MITFKEMIKNVSISDIPIAHQQNIEELLKKVNVLRLAYNKPLIVSSGYRSQQDHINIYYKKGITDLNKIPMKSKHLSGQAIDVVADNTKEFHQFILDNIDILEEQGLYCEDFEYTKTWTHIQCIPPRSGKRFFIP